MKKWNYQTHRYDDYTVPEDWKVSMYETDMEKEINCAECGKPMKYGESLTSQRIFGDSGVFGYAVCRECHESGLKERISMKTVTKEQCEAALGSISDAIEEYCLVVNKDVYVKLEKAQGVIHQLIEEHERLKGAHARLLSLWGEDLYAWRDETSQLLQDAGFEDASKYLDAAWEL